MGRLDDVTLGDLYEFKEQINVELDGTTGWISTRGGSTIGV